MRNCDDGTVEVLAAGPAAALAVLRTALQAGPPAALVADVTETPHEVDGYTEFIIQQ